jgi:hypothetical protein
VQENRKTGTFQESVERQAVVLDWLMTQNPEKLFQPLPRTIPPAEQVQVFRRPVRPVAPQREEECPFPEKRLAVRRTAQAVEEAFQAVRRQNRLKVFLPLAGEL